jgi:hypothetical protein
LAVLADKPSRPPLPAVKEANRLYGHSGYTGADAKELARLASKARDIEVTEELFLTICDRLVQGEPLVLICADMSMPARPHLMRYLYKNEKAREIYYAAREMQCETIVEEANIIATDDSNDSSYDPRGRRISHNEVVQRARLKIDQLRWAASKLAPKRYGDKNVTEIQGSANQPVMLQVITGVKRGPNSLIGGQLVAPKIIEGVVAKEGSIKDRNSTEPEYPADHPAPGDLGSVPL